MGLEFKESEPLSIGVEMEMQLLYKDTLDLAPRSPEILGRLRSPKIKAEIFQSMIEANTDICTNAHQVRSDLAGTIEVLESVCRPLGIRLASAGTHPTANYRQRKAYPAPRFMELLDRNQWIARRLVIFGLHVHLGMRSGKHAVFVYNELLHYLPILLALSASSPYWNGEDTELASSRITFFEASPVGGHPCQIRSWEHYEAIVGKLMRSKSIRSQKDIWWDLRICPDFGTLEVRICDGLPTLEETVAIAALIHAIGIHIDRLVLSGATTESPSDWVLRENKWRASRWGVHCELIFNEYGETMPFTTVIENLLRQLAPIVAEYNYHAEMDLIRKLVKNGPSYERQRLVAAQENGDLTCVVQSLMNEFEHQAPIWGSAGSRS